MKNEKLLKKFLENPTSVRYSQIEKLLISFGFEKIQSKGSHVQFEKEGSYLNISIPVHHNDCKNFYKKNI